MNTYFTLVFTCHNNWLVIILTVKSFCSIILFRRINWNDFLLSCYYSGLWYFFIQRRRFSLYSCWWFWRFLIVKIIEKAAIIFLILTAWCCFFYFTLWFNFCDSDFIGLVNFLQWFLHFIKIILSYCGS